MIVITGPVAAAALGILLATVAVRTGAMQQGGASAAATALIDDLLAERQTGEPSAEAFADRLGRTNAQLDRLRAIDRTALALDDRLDLQFAETILAGRALSLERMQFWKKDPRMYMTFRGVDALLGSPGDPNAKRDDLIRTLQGIARDLANGQNNLVIYVPRFQERGVGMAQTALGIFDKQVPAFASKITEGRNEVLEANAAARKALASYLTFLQRELPKRPGGEYAIGKVTYDAMLKTQYLLPYTSDALYKYAWDEFNRTVRELEDLARSIDASKTWQQLIVDVKNDQPNPLHLIEVHRDVVNKSRQHIVSKGLIPIPWKERCDVVVRPEHQRRNSFYGSFSGARSRESDPDGTLVGQWLLNPFDPTWDENTKREFMFEHGWGAVYVISPHETYPGHHVQGLYQMHNPRKLRRSEGTALFSEGWGLYTEQLMQETGFLPSERIHLQQLQSRLWRNARLIFVVGIHTGQMSEAEALSFMTEKVGFSRYAAEAEIGRAISSPDQQMTYFMGMMEILRMREDYKRRMGARFSLGEFHERLLKIGSMPVSLMREALFAGPPDTPQDLVFSMLRR